MALAMSAKESNLNYPIYDDKIQGELYDQTYNNFDTPSNRLLELNGGKTEDGLIEISWDSDEDSKLSNEHKNL